MVNSVYDIIKSKGILPGAIVVSIAGHDEGKTYLVLSIKEKIVQVADGRIRTADNPKSKRVTHVKALGIVQQSEMSKYDLLNISNEEQKNIFIRNCISCFFNENSSKKEK